MKLVGEIRNGAKHKLRALERMERKKSEAVEAPGDFIAHMVTKSRTNRHAARSSGIAQLHHGREEGVVPLTCGSELAATQWRGPGWSAKGGRRACCLLLGRALGRSKGRVRVWLGPRPRRRDGPRVEETGLGRERERRGFSLFLFFSFVFFLFQSCFHIISKHFESF